MKRVLPLLLPVLLTGCALGPRQSPPRSALLPPLPMHPGGVPDSRPPQPPRALAVQWDIAASCRDILETSPDAEHWQDFPGPYTVSQTGETPVYHIVLDTNSPLGYFRIRRDWGNPWIITPKTESKLKTEN